MKGGRGSRAEGRASRILGQKPRSVGEGREKNIERVGRLGLQGRSCLTHSEFSQLRGGSWGSWGTREGKGMDRATCGARGQTGEPTREPGISSVSDISRSLQPGIFLS